MPDNFYIICGKVHQAEAMEDFVVNAEKHGRKNTCVAAKATSCETSPDDSLAVGISGLSLEEREKQAIEEITCIKLEQRVHIYIYMYIYMYNN